jgi:hypothetical protein
MSPSVSSLAFGLQERLSMAQIFLKPLESKVKTRILHPDKKIRGEECRGASLESAQTLPD